MLTRLLVLWLLSERPMHGYAIKRILDDEAMSFWFPVEYGSIYSVLRTLDRRGDVRALPVERQGEAPERVRYAITAQGRTYLAEILREAWRRLPSPAEPLQAALMATGELDEGEVATLLAERVDALTTRLVDLERLARSAPAAELVERQRALTEAELGWARGALARRR